LISTNKMRTSVVVFFLVTLATNPCRVHGFIEDPVTACDGRGYAQYEKGELTGGTPCSNSTFCCYDDSDSEYQFGFDSVCGDFTGIICHGNETSSNCRGFNACAGASIGLVKDGCDGLQACERAKGIFASIEGRSCIGFDACAMIDFSINDGAIMGRSCVGEDACVGAVLRPGNIKNQSCVGSSACGRVEVTGNIQHQSCVGELSCNEARVNQYIQDQSCVGISACIFLSLSIVENNSCRERQACGFGNLGTVKDKSCVGYAACSDPWSPAPFSFIREIENESCIGNYSCADSNINSVKGKSCVGHQACGTDIYDEIYSDLQFSGGRLPGFSGGRLPGIVWVNILDIDGESCVGDDACAGTTISGAVTSKSCVGPGSCLFTSVTGDITNSCQGDKKCMNVTSQTDLENYNPTLSPTMAPTSTPAGESVATSNIQLFNIATNLIIAVGSLSLFLA